MVKFSAALKLCLVFCMLGSYVATFESELLSNDTLYLNVYYESLCPDSARFINTQLSTAYTQVRDILNITFVPFGKANYTKNDESNLWTFTCQHGDEECYGNLLHNCFIYYYPNVEDHFNYINCSMANQRYSALDTASICLQDLKIPLSKLIECANTTVGNNLLHEMGEKTFALKPKLNYVPWLTLNGIHTDTIQNEGENEDLVKLICKYYEGTKKPKACNSSVQFKANIMSFIILNLLACFFV